MIRTRYKKVLLVAPDVFCEQLLKDYKPVRRVSAVKNVFPSIFELTPDLIILDHDFLGKETEKILRRITTNKFYHNITICCFKRVADEKIDELLKILGVDHFIYRDKPAKVESRSAFPNPVASIIDHSLMKWMGSVAN